MLPNDFKPYLLRSFYEYLVDKDLTPYIHVFVNEFTQVPQEFVVHDAITLNIGMSACSDIQMSNEYIYFKARFSGQIREVNFPVGHVLSIYARENIDLILTFSLEKKTESLVLKKQEPQKMPKKSVQEESGSYLKVITKKDKD